MAPGRPVFHYLYRHVVLVPQLTRGSWRNTTRDQFMAGKNLGFLYKKLCFRFLRFFTYKCRTQNYDPQAKIRLCDNVNATNRNSYLNIICIKLVTQVKKTNKILTFKLRFLGF